MEQIKTMAGMLELISRPGFLVKNGIIVAVNKAAAGRMICTGTSAESFLSSAKEEYAAFEAGSIHMTFTQAGFETGVSVTRLGDVDVFLLDDSAGTESLNVLSVAAQQLRAPLADVVTVSEALLPKDSSASEQNSLQAAYLRRGLYQMQRILNNMSDAAGYGAPGYLITEALDLTAFFREFSEKASVYVGSTGRTLVYAGPTESIVTQADRHKLERAAYNMITNAARFSPVGSVIHVSLTKLEHSVCFTVQDEGKDNAMYAEGDICQRFMRTPSIEDGRQGLGLGLYITRAVARAHGGSLMSTFSEEDGNKVSMTIAIRGSSQAVLRSNVVRVDYSGGQDPALLEFADILPPEAYL